jgi:hypothetical protein
MGEVKLKVEKLKAEMNGRDGALIFSRRLGVGKFRCFCGFWAYHKVQDAGEE